MSDDQLSMFAPPPGAPPPGGASRPGRSSRRAADPSQAGMPIEFATVRLADALKVAEILRLRIEALRAAEGRVDAAARHLRRHAEARLDAGLGACLLRDPEAARRIEAALLATHGRRCELLAWVVMPNHVHVVCGIPPHSSLKAAVGAWKAAGARSLNRLLGREGSVWARDTFDRRMKDKEEEERAIRYVEGNPMLAGLVASPEEWPASSARFRNAEGRLDAERLAAAAVAVRAERKAAAAERGVLRAGAVARRTEGS